MGIPKLKGSCHPSLGSSGDISISHSGVSRGHRQPTFEDPVMMRQREVYLAEQQHVSGHPRMAGFEGIRPSLALDRPWREEFLKTSRFNVPRYIVCPPGGDPCSPVVCPSTQCSRTPGTATTGPNPNDMLPHVCTYSILSISHRRNNSPAGITEWSLGRRTHTVQVLLEPHHTPEYRHWPLQPQLREISRDNDGSGDSPISTIVTS